jgi:cell division protein FtsI (penicillin-binding protein 3)
MAGEHYIPSRIYLIYLLTAGLAMAVLIRILHIQIRDKERYEALAKEMTLKYFEIEENRGNIYASDGSLLSTSIPIFEIRLDLSPSVIPDALFFQKIDSLSTQLSVLFQDKSAFEYRAALTNARRSGERYYLLRRNVSYPELKSLRSFPILKRGRYGGGLIAIQKNRREKPFRILAARTIGFDREGYHVGLEGAYREELAGVSGRRLKRRINNNVWIPVNEDNEIEPQDGNDIVTHIDVNIQDVAEHSLLQHLQRHDADHGCAVLMEVNTGYVVAIANLERIREGVYEERYNYAVGESAEPGSTFKLASLMVALEDRKIDLDETVDTREGKVQYYGKTMKDAHEGGYGMISVQEAFELSSNVGISQIISEAYSAQPQAFIDGLRKMGLGQTLGIEIPGEGQAQLKDTRDKSWSGLSLPWISIGYEVAFTPMQILAFYNAIANDGVMVKPQFVREVRRGGQLVRRHDPVILHPSIASSANLAKARILLEGVVENGTAKELSRTVYRIAGKTGTAQIARKEGGYNKQDYRASFVGYFPADAPRYSCIVVIDGPRQGYIYGASVAAPVFRDIADKVYATRLDIQDTQDSLLFSGSAPIALGGHTDDLHALCSYLGSTPRVSEHSSEWVIPLYREEGVEFLPRLVKEGIVPNVLWMNAKDAIYILESLGLQVSVRGAGAVKKQSVEPGSPITRGASIVLDLS